MERIWETDNRAISLDVSIQCKGKCKFRVIASAPEKNSKYADRVIEVDGSRTIYLSFPFSPEKMKIVVVPTGKSAPSTYLVDIKEKTLKTYEIYTDQESREFLRFASEFSRQCGYSPASPFGRIFKTNSGKFKIKYYPVIMDGNKVSSTPARIGHRTGNIDVAKLPFDRYTIPMRMIILLHEFSHVYRNPKIGIEISNEIGADLNALYLYLGMGFSKIDAIYVFAHVFYKAQTKGNRERMRKIMDYIQRFENGEFAKVLTK
jgi:hypothetical protein